MKYPILFQLLFNFGDMIYFKVHKAAQINFTNGLILLNPF